MNFKKLSVIPITLFVYFLVSLSLTNTLYAHDFWLEAKPFYSDLGEEVDIDVIVGEDMFGETIPNIPAKYSDFSYTLNNGRSKVSGEMARYPAGYLQPPHAGTYVIGYRSKEMSVTLEGKKFTQYLKKEGLDKIIELRQKNNQSNDKAKEIYSRCAKTIIKVSAKVSAKISTNKPDDISQTDYSKQNFNYTLEITPLKNPYQLKEDDTLPVKVTYLGKALPKTLVTAFTKEAPWSKQKVRTNALGITQLKLDKSGHWLIKSVEMIPSKRTNIHWESFWASLTFELK